MRSECIEPGKDSKVTDKFNQLPMILTLPMLSRLQDKDRLLIMDDFPERILYSDVHIELDRLSFTSPFSNCLKVIARVHNVVCRENLTEPWIPSIRHRCKVGRAHESLSQRVDAVIYMFQGHHAVFWHRLVPENAFADCVLEIQVSGASFTTIDVPSNVADGRHLRSSRSNPDRLESVMYGLPSGQHHSWVFCLYRLES